MKISQFVISSIGMFASAITDDWITFVIFMILMIVSWLRIEQELEEEGGEDTWW